MTTKNGFTKQNKFAIGLLSMGTFLEFFDLKLYIYMAIVLDALFFPETDPTTKLLFSATAFSSTFMLRPIGGYLMGRIGDRIGRKRVIVITTFIMSTTCLIMAFVPTYAEIGLYATGILIFCRAMQGVSTVGEGMGALIYVTESMKSPYRYMSIGFIDVGACLGAVAAMSVASYAISSDYGWRVAFIIGSVVSVIGFFARSNLPETPEFLHYRSRMKLYDKLRETNTYYFDNNKAPIDKKNIVRMFFSIFTVPLSFYVAYMYMASFMKESLGMTPQEVISHNLKLDIIGGALAMFIIALLCKKFHPLKLLRINYVILTFTILVLPYVLDNIVTSKEDCGILLFFQILMYSYSGTFYNEAIYLKTIPVAQRFTIIGTMYGISTAVGYAVASYGIPFVTKSFGHYGLWFFYGPAITGFMIGMNYLIKKEKERKAFYEYPLEPMIKDTALDEKAFSYELPEAYSGFDIQCEYSEELLDDINKAIRSESRTVNLKLIQKAMIFAKKWHHGQKRKTEEPYYSHVFAVAGIISKYYLKTDVIIAGLLHDILEDTSCPDQEIENHFNSRILQMVVRLTRRRYSNPSSEKQPLQELLDLLEDLDDNESVFVKYIDRLHNLITVDRLSYEKGLKISDESSLLIKKIFIIADKLNICNDSFLEDQMFRYLNRRLNIRNFKKKYNYY